MRIYQINIVYGEKSTGRIVSDLNTVLKAQGHESRAAYGRGKERSGDAYRIDTNLEVYKHVFMSRIFDNVGEYSRRATRKLIADIRQFQPDIIHLHNIHGYYVNVRMLFSFLIEYNKPVVWTLHDCWAFTGHCAYFDRAECTKWKIGCDKCPAKGDYPASLLLDKSKENYLNKKDLFSTIENLSLVTPSRWLENLVKQSFLKEKKCAVINNGIDVDTFCYRDSVFRQRKGIESSTKIILGVAGNWAPRKGLQDFLRIRELLGKEYVIILVGLKQKNLRNMPKGIIGIEKTDSTSQLAEIYSAADVFVNPTYEDNFPTVNIEALACGTPVITYDTGGSGECISLMTGKIVPKGNVEGLIDAIKEVTSREKDITECSKQAMQFAKETCYNKYIELYEEILR